MGGSLDNYGTFTNHSGSTMNTTGLVTNHVGATMTIDGKMNVSDEGFTNYGSFIHNGSSPSFGDSIDYPSSSHNHGSFVNNGGMWTWGEFTNHVGGVVDNVGGMTTSGHYYNEGTINNPGEMGPGNITNQAGGVINNQNSFSVRFNGHNYGTILNPAGSILSVEYNASLTNYAGGTIVNDGVMSGAYGPDSAVTNFGTLSGSGSVSGTLNDSGILAPGNSAGVYTIEGDYDKSGGSIEIELGGHFDGGGDKTATEFDWIDVADDDPADVNITGNTMIDLSFIDGFGAGDVSPGDQFDIIQFDGSLTGFGFLSLDDSLAPLGANMAWGLGMDASSVFLTINSVPEPSTFIMATIGLLGLGLLGWRRRNAS